jgi:hypothetical protein
MINLHIEFYIPNSVNSLVTAVILKVKEYFCIAAMLLLHIMQSICLGKNCIILKDLLFSRTEIDTNGTPTSEVCEYAFSYYSLYKITYYNVGVAFIGITLISNVMKISSNLKWETYCCMFSR